MPAEFSIVEWDEDVAAAAKVLVDLALTEDLAGRSDVTTELLVPEGRQGAARVVAREAGVACGLAIGELVRDSAGAGYRWTPAAQDGDAIGPGQCLATIEGSARELLTCERTILNFMGRLSGIATLTRRFVDEGAGSDVYDTRKTTPGWRLLEKFAVRCGGGCNHRLGLYDAVLIKDNHLAQSGSDSPSLAAVVQRFRQRLNSMVPIEIEVDTLAQLEDAIHGGPDIVLLDNMRPEQLRQAVAIRDRDAPEVVLEASGGVNLGTIRAIAETGVDRISVGALTHSATGLDIGLDWA